MGRIKVDENLSVRAAQIFAARGHDVEAVPSEGLQGRSDEVIYEICRLERRCLVTLDLGFGNILRFPAALSGGIVILKPGREMNLPMILSLARQAADLLASREVAGTL